MTTGRLEGTERGLLPSSREDSKAERTSSAEANRKQGLGGGDRGREQPGGHGKDSGRK